MKKLLILLSGIVIFSGCYYDKADQLYPSTTAGPCDTSNIAFTKDIIPILQSKCATAGCHDATTKQNGYSLGTYDGAKLAVDDGKLVGCVRWDNGFIQMPQGMPKLDECSINKIVRWVNQGAQNN